MKVYQTPEIEVLTLLDSDILTASNGTPLLPYSWFEENTSEGEI